MYCNNCGVELEDSMQHCPLCGQPVGSVNETGGSSLPSDKAYSARQKIPLSQPEKKHIWEIISITLLSATVATFLIDFVLNRRITWSEYPIALCLIIFSYISLAAFLKRNFLFEMAVGLAISSIIILILDALTQGISWTLKLGIPLLLSVNLIGAAFISVIRHTKDKGINLIAWGFIAAGIQCVCTEMILSFFTAGVLRLQWSIIALGCIMPAAIVLFYMHTRLKKGRNLNRTFHI